MTAMSMGQSTLEKQSTETPLPGDSRLCVTLMVKTEQRTESPRDTRKENKKYIGVLK